MLARRREQAEVYQPAYGLSDLTAQRVERYLDAVRSTLLFAKGVILVEGDAELVMIPAMIKAVFGLSADEMGISVIAMNSAFFEHVAAIFHNERIRRRCAIVTDLDKSLIDLLEDSQDDDEKQKHARAAQEAGERRHQSLAAFTQNNPWVSAFFAKHTFEVDFLEAENAREAEQTLDTIYTRRRDKERVKEALNASELSISGQEILKLAKKVGKGWYALLLSEQVHADTFIPEYILRAIAFASGGMSVDIIKRMGLHRIENEYFNEEIRTQFPEIVTLKTMPPKEFIDFYRETAPEDSLSELVDYLEENL